MGAGFSGKFPGDRDFPEAGWRICRRGKRGMESRELLFGGGEVGSVIAGFRHVFGPDDTVLRDHTPAQPDRTDGGQNGDVRKQIRKRAIWSAFRAPETQFRR